MCEEGAYNLPNKRTCFELVELHAGIANVVDSLQRVSAASFRLVLHSLPGLA